jgi:hypothetical protein
MPSTSGLRFLKWGAITVALLALAGCDHRSRLDTPLAVKRAFAKEGFVLVTRLPRRFREGRSRVLVAKSGEPFIVVVARTVEDAKSYYRLLNRQRTRGSFDLRERNVLTISDEGLTRSDKARLRRAMRRLR